MTRKSRFIAAYFIAPMTPTIFFILLPIITGMEYSSRGIFLVAFFSLPLSYLSCFIGGYSLVYLLNKNNILSLRYVIAGGILLGIVVWFLIILMEHSLSNSNQPLLRIIRVLWLGPVFGVSVAMPFGLIAGIPWKLKR